MGNPRVPPRATPNNQGLKFYVRLISPNQSLFFGVIYPLFLGVIVAPRLPPLQILRLDSGVRSVLQLVRLPKGDQVSSQAPENKTKGHCKKIGQGEVGRQRETVSLNLFICE